MFSHCHTTPTAASCAATDSLRTDLSPGCCPIESPGWCYNPLPIGALEHPPRTGAPELTGLARPTPQADRFQQPTQIATRTGIEIEIVRRRSVGKRKLLFKAFKLDDQRRGASDN